MFTSNKKFTSKIIWAKNGNKTFYPLYWKYIGYDKKISLIFYETQIKISSPNIIDLIEVGDYVNGEKVCAIGENSGDVYIRDLKEFILAKDIKSIVTHEQFSQMEYRIEEK